MPRCSFSSLDAPFWARNPHLQTVLGRWWAGAVSEPRYESMRLGLADGDVLTYRVAQGPVPVVVYLFAEPGESADAPPLRRAAARFAARGYTVVLLNPRGSAEGRWHATRGSHAASSVDLGAVVQTNRVFFPEARHLAVGYGLAGSALLLLMGRDWDAGAPDAAVAVCPPVDLPAWVERQRRGMGFLHGWRTRRNQAREIRARSDVGLIPPVELPFLLDQEELDAAFTASTAGCSSAADYYASCSAGPYLSRIQAPTVVLCTEDDPLAPSSDLQGFSHGSGLMVHSLPYGGHRGFMERGARPWTLRSCLEDLLEAWMLEFTAGGELTAIRVPVAP